ncbi:MAG: UBP-type zinc finger domain-containing protein [Lentisphaeria bacterium]|nr:UBP-type zinc finger domain-containing protein [Lentisphaeria bacterium]
MRSCDHINPINEIIPASDYVCSECVKIDSTWVHLRTCQSCGVTLCCDSSPNQHMHKHCKLENHPVISSAEPGENWLFCFVDSEKTEYE